MAVGNTGLAGSTGLHITSPNGFTGIRPNGFTGIRIQGITGPSRGPSVPSVPSDLEPIKKNKGYFSNTGKLHCPFGPALEKTKIWYIDGKELDKKTIKEAKKILKDVTIAPLYLNDPILNYPARWILKYGTNKIY